MLAIIAAIAALVSVPATPALANDAPTITGAAVLPTDLPRVGGSVTVNAFVSDDLGPVEVYADVSGPGSETHAMSAGSADDWSGTFDLPPNLMTSPVAWTITVRARDLDQLESTAFAGTVTVAAGHLFDLAPVVTDPSTTPSRLPSSGGAVTLAVTATDDSALRDVHANVMTAPGAQIQVPLAAIGGDRFTGTWSAPANAGDSDAQYPVQLVAEDDVGQVTAIDGAAVVVGAAVGRLTVRPGSVRFGSVRLGHRSTRVVTVTNSGAKGAAVVIGRLRSTDGEFSVIGDGRFRLQPGRSASFLVRFRPSAVGTRAGRLEIVRSGNAKWETVAGLQGRGLPARP